MEEVRELAGHDRADAAAGQALRERVDELAEAHGVRRRVLEVAEAVDHHALGAGPLDVVQQLVDPLVDVDGFAIIPGPPVVQRTFVIAGLVDRLPFVDVPRA
jgi:hypothetical protein